MVDGLFGKKVIGVKQSIKFLKDGKGKTLYLAKDAKIEIINPLKSLAKNQKIDIEYVDTMKELGKICGIEVKAAAALFLK